MDEYDFRKIDKEKALELSLLKAECKCHACDKIIEVDFILPPTEEDKLGFYCEECANEIQE